MSRVYHPQGGGHSQRMLRVAVRRSDVEAYQECFRRGLNRGEFYVGKLKADPDGIPPWGTFESDWSLYEATDPDEPPDDA